MGYERDADIGFPNLPVEEKQRCIATKRSVSADGAGDNVSLFKVVGAIRVYSLIGKFTDVTDVSAVTAAYLDLYDDGAHVITKATGTDLSTATVGSIVGRNAAATTAMHFTNASDGAVAEGDRGTDGLAGFLAIAETGTATYIRFNFTSDEGGYDFTIAWGIVWTPLTNGSYIESV